MLDVQPRDSEAPQDFHQRLVIRHGIERGVEVVIGIEVSQDQGTALGRSENQHLGLPVQSLPQLPDILLDSTPEILEAHHVTGEDCFVLKVLARSMRHLEEINGRISGLGAVTTSVVYSSPLAGRPIASSPDGDSGKQSQANGGKLASSE